MTIALSETHITLKNIYEHGFTTFPKYQKVIFRVTLFKKRMHNKNMFNVFVHS